MRHLVVIGLLLLVQAHLVTAELQISEFLTANEDTLADDNGEYSDWIEIHNSDPSSASLVGHYLTDDPLDLTKWSFPDNAAVPGNGYVLVFASGQDRTSEEWHTSFSLSSGGESLLLVSTDGTTIIDAYLDYPKQRPGISHGLGESGEKGVFFIEPTPGAPNPDGLLGFAKDTKFSVDRGIYAEPILVEITSATPDARILYTTDGSEPSIFAGKVYREPLDISSTTILRAAASKTRFIKSNVDTHTYLFLGDVLRQDGEGLPNPPKPAESNWDYEMDPIIVEDPRFAPTLMDDLMSLRTMSIVMPVADLWGVRGVYANPTQLGDLWERACSMEILHPNEPSKDIQVNAGLRLQGAGSRFRDLGKKSMRVAFRGEYGSKKLRYPLYGDTHPNEHDTVVLRGSYFDSWTAHNAGGGTTRGRNNAFHFRSDFGHLTHKAMGAHVVLSDWMHLYLNGQYWGVYNIHERPDESFAAVHLGGDESDYDILKQRPRGQANGSKPELVNGDFEAWDALMSLIRQDVTDDAVYMDILTGIDVNQFIDYLLLNFWGGNRDWPHNNWYAIRNRPNNGPFIFYCWDTENFIADPRVDRTDIDTNNSPGILYDRLKRNAEFRLRFADRTHKLLFNSGALSEKATTERISAFRSLLQSPLNAESARWGDTRTEPPLNTLDSWLPAIQYSLENYFPQRNDLFLNQLKAANIYPTLNPPEFEQHGGDVEAPYALTLPSSLFSEVYYTLDGSDPREASALRYKEPIILTESTVVKVRRRSDTRWSALNEAWFRINTVDASADNLALTEIQPQDDFEFLELTNTSNQIVDLSGLRFAKGIRFTFEERTTVPAQGKLILAREAAAFTARYPDRAISGEYVGSLNNGGERVLLVGKDDSTVLDIQFDNSMEGFEGDPEADQDQDGIVALLEYALGTSDQDPQSGPNAISLSVSNNEIVFQFTARNDAPDLTYEVEVSSNLSDWDSGADLVLEDGDVDETQVQLYRIPRAYQYVRLKVASIK